MKGAKILSQEEIKEKLNAFPGWEYGDSKIRKELEFKDFLSVVEFINRLAPYCEKMDHHPDIHIFYNKVLFELQRFDAGGKVTDKDFMVAGEIERLFGKN